jgi:hypothetical protein
MRAATRGAPPRREPGISGRFRVAREARTMQSGSAWAEDSLSC